MRPEYIDGKRTLVSVPIDKEDYPALTRLNERIEKLPVGPLPVFAAFR